MPLVVFPHGIDLLVFLGFDGGGACGILRNESSMRAPPGGFAPILTPADENMQDNIVVSEGAAELGTEGSS
jgi:hypothetical protein